MIGGEFEARVEGPFAEQHALVKCGSFLAIMCFSILSNYIPLALAVWLVVWLLVGAPAPVQHSLLEWALFAGFMVGLLGGMVAIWCYCMVGFVGWVAGERLTRRQLAAVLGGISLGPVLVAGAARLLGRWDWVFLVAVATMFGCGIAAVASIRVGQALRWLHRARANHGAAPDHGGIKASSGSRTVSTPPRQVSYWVEVGWRRLVKRLHNPFG